MGFFVACDDRNPNYNDYYITPNLELPVSKNSSVTLYDEGTRSWVAKSLQQIMLDVKVISGTNFNGFYLKGASGNVGYYYVIIPFRSDLTDNTAYLAHSPYVRPSASDVWKGYAGVSRKNAGYQNYYYYNGNLVLNPYNSWNSSMYQGADGKYYDCFDCTIDYNNQRSYPAVVAIEADECYINAQPVITYTWHSIKSLNLANIEDLMPYSSPYYQFEEHNSTMLLSFIPDEYLNGGESVSDGEHFTIKEPSLNSYITQFNDTTYNYKNLYLKTKKYARLGRRVSSSYNSFHLEFLSAIGVSPQITYYEKYIDVASVDGVPYLGFIVDENNHAAKLNIIFLKTTLDVLSGLEKKTVDFNTIAMTDSEMSGLYTWLTGAYGFDESSEDTETNQPQGGDETDPVINTPLNPLTLPYKGAFKSGFVKLYEVTDTQLQSLCEYMWDTNFINSLVRLFNDPRQIIIGIMVFPVTPSQKSIDVDIYAGNLNTGIKGNLLNQEYQTVEAGELRIPKGNADFMSFYPHRKIKLNIPYCGEHEIDPSAVYGATLRLYYHLSFFSGVCIAEVTRQFEGGDEEPMWFFGGQIAFDIPMSSEDFSRAVAAIISAGVTLGTSLGNFATGNVVGGTNKALGAAGSLTNGSLSPEVGYSSGGGSTSGFLSTQQPYAIFETPITAFDGVQSNYIGNTYYKVVKLDDCTGYTKCFEAHIESVHATDDELEEINSWLTKGVLIRHDGNATPSDTPVVSGNTVITFMKLTSERNTIGKKWTDAVSVEGKLIYDQSYTEPSILVEQNVIGYNYAYIGLFGRFYFVNDVIIRKNDMVEVVLKSDPLQSFKDEIRGCYAAVERQKSDGNAFIDDPYRWTQVNKKISIKPFEKDGVPFDFAHANDTYILIVAGK